MRREISRTPAARIKATHHLYFVPRFRHSLRKCCRHYSDPCVSRNPNRKSTSRFCRLFSRRRSSDNTRRDSCKFHRELWENKDAKVFLRQAVCLRNA